MEGFFVFFVVLVVGQSVWEIVLMLANAAYLRKRSALVPEVLSDVLTMDVFSKAVSYTIDKHRLSIFEEVASALLNLWWLLAGIPLVEKVVVSFSENLYVQALLFYALLGGVSYVVGLPFSVYSVFVIEEKYGFNRMTVRKFVADALKSLALTALLAVPVISIVMWVLTRFGVWWWQLSLLVTGFVLFLNYIGPVLIMPLFNKFRDLEEGDLKDQLTKLLSNSGVRVPRIQVMDASTRTKHANAFVAGFGNSRKLVLFDNILSFRTDEILAVVGHELGHHVRGHLWKLMLVEASLSCATLAFANWVYNYVAKLQMLGVSKPFSFLTYSLLFTGAVMFFVKPLVNAFSRQLEYEADRFSADLLGSPDPLVSALKSLYRSNLSNPTPAPLYKIWNYSHPAPGERVEALVKMRK